MFSFFLLCPLLCFVALVHMQAGVDNAKIDDNGRERFILYIESALLGTSVPHYLTVRCLTVASNR